MSSSASTIQVSAKTTIADLIREGWSNTTCTNKEKGELLRQAALEGNAQLISELCRNNMKSSQEFINSQDADGWTPLHYAAIGPLSRQRETVKALKQWGADKKIETTANCEIGGPDVRFKVPEGTSYNKLVSIFWATLPDFWASLPKDLQLEAAEVDGACDFLLCAIEEYTPEYTLKRLNHLGLWDRQGAAIPFTPLGKAAFEGNMRAVEWLIDQRIRPSENDYGWDPLFCAALSKNRQSTAIIKWFIDYGLNPNGAAKEALTLESNGEKVTIPAGATPLRAACSFGNEKTAIYLFKKGALIHPIESLTDREKANIRSLLQHNIHHSQYAELSKLEGKGSFVTRGLPELLSCPPPDEAPPQATESPFGDQVLKTITRESTYWDLVEAMRGTPFNFTQTGENDKRTALGKACQESNLPLIRALILISHREELDLINQVDGHGWTPLCYAAYRNDGNYKRSDILELLIHNGADKEFTTASAHNGVQEGASLLSIAEKTASNGPNIVNWHVQFLQKLGGVDRKNADEESNLLEDLGGVDRKNAAEESNLLEDHCFTLSPHHYPMVAAITALFIGIVVGALVTFLLTGNPFLALGVGLAVGAIAGLAVLILGTYIYNTLKEDADKLPPAHQSS